MPLIVLLAWWLGSFLLYMLPWPLEYEHTAFFFVMSLWLVCCGALAAGYGLGGSVRSRETTPVGDALPRIGLIAQWTLLPLIVAQYSGMGFGDIGTALTDQGAAYRLASEAIEVGADSRRTLTIVLSIANVAVLTSLPYYAFRWFTSRQHTLGMFLAAAPPVLVSVYTGRDSLLAPTVMAVFGAALVAFGRRQIRVSKGLVWSAILISAVAVAAFVARKFARYVIDGVTFQLSSCAPGTTCDTIPMVGSPTAAVQTLASYITQGYEGLGYALGARWAFGGGYSHSPAIRRILSDEAQPRLVTDQLDDLGWSSGGYWSTGLAHIANDAPWPLVPFVILTVGLLLRRIWGDALRAPDPVNITAFGYWLFLLFMMPQNLTLALNGPQYVAVLVLTGIWAARLLPGVAGRPAPVHEAWPQAGRLCTWPRPQTALLQAGAQAVDGLPRHPWGASRIATPGSRAAFSRRIGTHPAFPTTQ